VGSSQTAVELSNDDDAGLYFRTAPSDVLQGQVLADRILAGDSESGDSETVAILARDDAYGRGLATTVSERIEAEGGEVIDTVFFATDASRYARQVAAIAETEPDAIVLISFDEAGKIIEELVEQGMAPNVS
jgi:ABC-type branched-subunit amino acid transport system substrate-binding protein